MSLISETAVALRSSRYWLFISNLGWLTADKFVRLGLGLIVGVATARYLQPVGFGILNYASAIVGLTSAFAGLGLDSIVQRDLIRDPESGRRSLATCLGLKVIGGIGAYALLAIFLSSQESNSLTRQATLIIGLSLFNGLTPTLDSWFQSQVQAKYSVYAQNIGFFISSAFRLWLIAARKPLILFAWASVLEFALGAILLSLLFAKQQRTWDGWRFDWSLGQRWLSESWTLVLSGLAIMVYMRIDQVMLARMVDQYAVGVYSAAVRVSEVGYFIPMILASTFLPSIVQSRGLNDGEYQSRRQRFFDLNSVIAFVVIVPAAAFAKWIVHALYGTAYLGAADILIVHIWSALFVFTGVARSQYLLSENLLRFSLYSTVAGALINVLLNFALIPRMGGLGCAWATLIAYAASAFVSSFLSKSVRPMGWQQIKSFILPTAVIRLATIRR